MKNLKIAVIGYGYWGPNLVRNFINLENCTVSHVVDELPGRLAKVKKLYPAINTTSFLNPILENPEINDLYQSYCTGRRLSRIVSLLSQLVGRYRKKKNEN